MPFRLPCIDPSPTSQLFSSAGIAVSPYTGVELNQVLRPAIEDLLTRPPGPADQLIQLGWQQQAAPPTRAAASATPRAGDSFEGRAQRRDAGIERISREVFPARFFSQIVMVRCLARRERRRQLRHAVKSSFAARGKAADDDVVAEKKLLFPVRNRIHAFQRRGP